MDIGRLFPTRHGHAAVSILGIAVFGATCSGLLHGAELSVRETWGGIDLLPARLHFTLDSPTVSSSGDDALDSDTGITVGARYSFARPGDAVGLVLDAALEASDGTYDRQADALLTVGGRLGAGLGYAPADHWLLLTEGAVDGGYGRFSLPALTTSPAFSARGHYVGYDIRAVASYQFTPGWSVGIDVGYAGLTYGLSGSGINLDLRQSGIFVGLELAWHWSNIPQLLR